jgi:outer membrane protein OmpA-like peptidoglycan-associated protein
VKALSLALLLSVSGCAASFAALQGWETQLRANIHRAKALGAMECAPADLAVAQASYRFAQLELAESDTERAREHIEVGLAATERALARGPVCSARGIGFDPSADPALDADGDGVADANDKCPHQLEDVDSVDDEDGCPDPDNDGDGMPDGLDTCPKAAEDFDGRDDGDGCPDNDDDGDGILDADDRCPTDAEVVNGLDDDDGCPDFVAKHVRVDGDKLILDIPVQFTDGTEMLLDPNADTLKEIVALLGQNAAWRLRIEGHLDNKGEAAALTALSERRANAVREVLVGYGLDRERIQTAGLGGTKPIDTNRTELGRAKNRRIDFFVVQRGP